MRGTAIALMAAMGMGAGALSSPVQAQQQYNLVVGTQGGTMYRLGAGLTEAFNKVQDAAQLSSVPGGGAANPARVGSGGGDLGFSFSNFAVLAYNGDEPFKEEFKNLRHVSAFWGACYHQYIAQELYDGGITTWEDIVASEEPLAIGAGSSGTSTDAINRLILAHLDTSFEELEERGYRFSYAGMGAISEQLRSGQVDMYFHNSGDPNAAGVEAALGRDITFMDMSDSLKEMLANAGFSECEIPGGIYDNVDEPHASMGALGVLLTTEDMDADVVYSLLKTTNDELEFLGNVHSIFKTWTPEFGAASYGVPLHEGAERFYKEAGVID